MSDSVRAKALTFPSAFGPERAGDMGFCKEIPWWGLKRLWHEAQFSFWPTLESHLPQSHFSNSSHQNILL